jgi:hypothetical protein
MKSNLSSDRKLEEISPSKVNSHAIHYGAKQVKDTKDAKDKPTTPAIIKKEDSKTKANVKVEPGKGELPKIAKGKGGKQPIIIEEEVKPPPPKESNFY